jgi:hypothetical protein
MTPQKDLITKPRKNYCPIPCGSRYILERQGCDGLVPPAAPCLGEPAERLPSHGA